MMNNWLCFAVILVLACYGESQTPAQGKCTTPDGKQGTCKPIRQCPSLSRLNATQASNPQIQSFRNSSCSRTGSGDTRVCCPSNGAPTTKKPANLLESRSSPALDSQLTLLSPPNCGRTEVLTDKIVGGSPSQLGSWPWMAALGFKMKTNPGPIWLCGGALVSDRHVITAAHCTGHPNYTMSIVRLGELDLDPSVVDGANPVDVKVNKVVRHPNYDPSSKMNDIALVKLDTAVTFSKYVQPICLPKSPELRSSNFADKSPFVAGWGRTGFQESASSKLMEVQLEVVENDKCKKAYARKGGVVSSKQICAGIEEGGKDACLGDSGGPLMTPSKGTDFYLIGVVSYGYQCAEPGFPGIYTRVTDYLNWISETISTN